MAKYYNSGKLNPLLHLMRINHLTTIDLSKILNVTQTTMRGYVNNPCKMNLFQLSCLGGYFGVKIEVLCYILLRNKTQIRPKDKNDKWYIESVRLEGDELLDKVGDFPRE